ncbi:MAG: integrase family protein [Gammaproteobacteria bacterium]|nr:integrase family protein [Gammaproteobacteria bacterium]
MTQPITLPAPFSLPCNSPSSPASARVTSSDSDGPICARRRWTDSRSTSFTLSKTSKRLAIEVTPELEAVLDQCWQLKGGGHAGSEYIVPTRNGKPYTSEGFRACWQRVRIKWERSGGRPLHFHDIRALAATKCPTLEMAQQLLGHSNPAMTRRVYRRGVERVKPLQLIASNQQM